MKQDTAATRDIARLWKEYKVDGNGAAKDAIIIHYLGLVKFVAGRIAMNSPPHVEENDLIGWGVLGLLDAVEKFDLGQNVSFETYASTRIRGAIIDQIRLLDWAPRSLRQKARRMEQAAAQLREQLGRSPTEAEIASEMAITEDEVFGLITEIHGAYIISLDTVITGEDDDEVTLEQITSDLKSPSPEVPAIRREAEQRLAAAIAKLPETERHVITLYYYDELTLKEIGKVLGLTESRICQIHHAVIRKLKQFLKASSRDAIH